MGSDNEMAVAAAVAAHTAARDGKDLRDDTLTIRLLGMVEKLQGDVINHMHSEAKTVDELQESISRLEGRVAGFINAFPKGDPDAHRIAHERIIEESTDSRQFWRAIRLALAILMLGGIASWIGVVVWRAFLMGPK